MPGSSLCVYKLPIKHSHSIQLMLGRGRRRNTFIKIFKKASDCMDARGDLALLVFGGLERLSGGSGWRGYLLHFTGAGRIAASGSRPARSGRRLGHPGTWRASATIARGQERLAVTSTHSSHRRRPNRGSRLTPCPVTDGAQVCCLRPVFPQPSVTHRVGFGQPTVSPHEVSTVQVCCFRPVFLSVTHRAVGLGGAQVSRLLEPRVWPALPLSPTRPGRCHRHVDSDTNFRSGRSVSCAIDDS